MEQQERGKAPAPEAAPAQQQEQQAKAQAAARLRALVEQQQAERQRRDEKQLQKREAQSEQPDVEALLAQDRRLAQKEEEDRQRKLREEQERAERMRREELARQELARQELARQELARQERARREQARREQARQEQAWAERATRAAAVQQRKDSLWRCQVVCGLLLFFGFDQCLGILLQGAATVFPFLRSSGISATLHFLPLFGPALLTAGSHLVHKLPEEDRFPTLRRLCPWLWTAPLYNIAIGMYLAGTVLRVFGSGRFFSSLREAAVYVVLNFLLTIFLDARLPNWLLPWDDAP